MTVGGEPQIEADGLRTFFHKLGAADRSPSTDELRNFFNRFASLVSTPSQPSHSTQAVVPQSLQLIFEKLRPALIAHRKSAQTLNVWAASGLAHDEVRISSVLAWFLNPNGSHGEGSLFAEILWSAVDGRSFGFEIDRMRRSATEVNPLADLSDRVDVVLDGDDFSVFIEVKIHAALQPAQLERYVKAVERSASLRDKRHYALIYLAPNNTTMPNDRCRWLSWRSLAQAFRNNANRCLNPFVGQLALQFADHIERH